jgi:hypothetical protein
MLFAWCAGIATDLFKDSDNYPSQGKKKIAVENQFSCYLSSVSLKVGHNLVCVNPLTPELNPSAQRCLMRLLLGIMLLEPCISLIYAWIRRSALKG